MESNYSTENGNYNSSHNPMESNVETSTSTSYDSNRMTMQADHRGFSGTLLGFAFFFVLIAIAIYIYYAMAFQRMAQKINIPNDWYAWIPGLNLVLIFRIANRPLWWMVFLIIPGVNIVVNIIVWMDVAKAMRKPEWLGILIAVPVVNLAVPGYLAFSDDTSSQQQGVNSGEEK